MKLENGIHLVVKGEKGNVMGALTEVPSVVDVTVEKEQSGFVQLIIYGKMVEELTEEIRYKLAKEQIPIYSIEKIAMA